MALKPPKYCCRCVRLGYGIPRVSFEGTSRSCNGHHFASSPCLLPPVLSPIAAACLWLSVRSRLLLATKVRRKGNTVAEKLDQDRISLEALGLVVPGLTNKPTPSTAALSTPSTPTIDVTAAANSSSSSSAVAASAAAAPPSVELLARMVGEVSPHTQRGDQTTGSSSSGSNKSQKKEDRVYSSILGGGGGGGGGGGVGGAATASATSRAETGGDGSGGSGTAGQHQQQQQQHPPGPASDPAADLISMDDLLEGWGEDEIPARWPSLTLSSEQPGAVTVLCTGRIGRKQPWVAPVASSTEDASGNVSTVTPAGGGGVDVPAAQQQASDGRSNGVGGVGAPGQNEPEAVAPETTGTPGPKRLSFRLPSTSSLGGSKTVSRSQSSSSFTLPTRLGRWAPKPTPVQVEEAVAVKVGAGDEVANKGRSPSPPPPPPPSSTSSSSSTLSTLRPLESLLPDSRELRAPPPPPLPPPLPHKADMWLVDPASNYSSSPFSGTVGGGGGSGGGAGGGGASTTTATMVGSLTSLPSFSSLLASAHGGRGGAAAHAASAPATIAASTAAGHGESAGAAAFGIAGGDSAGGSVSAAAEMVGEPQHMDQLFDMLELDLGIGGWRKAGAVLPGTARGDAARRGRASAFPHEADVGAAGVWGPGDGRDGLRSAECGGGGARQGRGAWPSAFGGGVDAAVDYNASLWHILQVRHL